MNGAKLSYYSSQHAQCVVCTLPILKWRPEVGCERDSASVEITWNEDFVLFYRKISSRKTKHVAIGCILCYCARCIDQDLHPLFALTFCFYVNVTMQIPYSVMEKRPSSTPSGQPSRPKATLSLPECTPSRKRARHRKQHLALACHQGTPSVSDSPTTSAQCPSSNKRQHPKPHTATSHTHKMASVAHCEVEQNTHFDTSPRTPQSRTDMPLAPVDGADHSSATSCCPCTLGRFTVPSLAPVVTFSGISRSFGVSGLPFTAFQLKAISVMFAARMDARLQHGGALSCKPVLLDVDDGVRYSNDSGVQVQGCVGHVSSTCSGGEGSSGVLKEVGDSETCDMHWVKTGRGESELTQQTVEKQTVAATVNNGTKLATNGGIPREMDQGKEKEERRGARPKKHHPDAFVAIRISSSEIRSSLERIQQSITSVESRLGPAMVSLDKLHLTLMVLRLGEEEERIAQ